VSVNPLPVQDVKRRSVSLRRTQTVELSGVSCLRGFLGDSPRRTPSSVPSAWQNFEYLPKDWRYFPKLTQKHLPIWNSTSFWIHCIKKKQMLCISCSSLKDKPLWHVLHSSRDENIGQNLWKTIQPAGDKSNMMWQLWTIVKNKKCVLNI